MYKTCVVFIPHGMFYFNFGLLTHRFPGAQPVSFTKESIDLLLNKEYVI